MFATWKGKAGRYGMVWYGMVWWISGYWLAFYFACLLVFGDYMGFMPLLDLRCYVFFGSVSHVFVCGTWEESKWYM